MSDPLKEQVGGSHYKSMAIQPVEFCQKNKLGMIESSVIKYMCRHKSKGGKQDLEKAIHLIRILIEMEYEEKDKTPNYMFKDPFPYHVPLKKELPAVGPNVVYKDSTLL